MRTSPWPHRQPAPRNTGAFALPFTLTGNPVLAAPVATSTDGLPVGVQRVGRHRSDETLVALARDLQTILGWEKRTPEDQSIDELTDPVSPPRN